MVPKEKAKELVKKFLNAKSEDGFINTNKYRHKECALITVNEILDSTMYYFDDNSDFVNYWQEVKQEIEKL